jgi:hypothetical protein
MKPKIGVYLKPDVAMRLKRAQWQSGATKSDIVNEALARFLDPAPEKDPRAEALQRLAVLTKRVRRLQRDVDIVAESLALHVRQFLMITPPVPQSEHEEAKRLGRERYAVFVAQIAKRIESDNGMVAEIMERIARTKGHRVRQAVGHGHGAMLPHLSQPLESTSHG